MNLRITHNSTDYTFQVIKKGPITKDTKEIEIIFEGESYKLQKNKQQWHCLAEMKAIDQALIQAIGKALSLRYRIYL